MTEQDHWLWRLSADAWLEAARRELEQASDQLGARRTAVTHARRAAGMALNGVLVAMADRGWSRERCETAWGRSYIDHLRALADPTKNNATEAGDPFAGEQADRCRALLQISVMPPTGLVRLATRKDEAAADARAVAAEITRACAALIGS